MEFKRVMSWFSDDKPETTEAVVYVSNCGVVKCGSYKHWNEKNQGYSVRKERVVKQTYNRGKQVGEPSWRKEKYGKGYANVNIRGKHYSVHRLVALAWIPNPEGKEQVNHLNGIRDDNRVENLQWCTNEENRAHAAKFLDRNVRKGSDVTTSKLTEDDVKEIRALISDGKMYQKDIAKKYGVAPSTITWIKNGGAWSHV